MPRVETITNKSRIFVDLTPDGVIIWTLPSGGFELRLDTDCADHLSELLKQAVRWHKQEARIGGK